MCRADLASTDSAILASASTDHPSVTIPPSYHGSSHCKLGQFHLIIAKIHLGARDAQSVRGHIKIGCTHHITFVCQRCRHSTALQLEEGTWCCDSFAFNPRAGYYWFPAWWDVLRLTESALVLSDFPSAKLPTMSTHMKHGLAAESPSRMPPPQKRVNRMQSPSWAAGQHATGAVGHGADERPWTLEERQAIRDAVIEHGEQEWAKVVQVMAQFGRSPEECRRHWTLTYPLIKVRVGVARYCVGCVRLTHPALFRCRARGPRTRTSCCRHLSTRADRAGGRRCLATFQAATPSSAGSGG